MLSPDDGQVNAVLGIRFFFIRIKYIIFYKISFPSIAKRKTSLNRTHFLNYLHRMLMAINKYFDDRIYCTSFRLFI